MNVDEPVTVTALKTYCTACSKEFIVPTTTASHDITVGNSFRWCEMCPGCWERGGERVVVARLEFDGSAQPRREYLVATPVVVSHPDEAPTLDLFRVEAATEDEAAARAVAIIGSDDWWERVCGLDLAEGSVIGQFRLLPLPTEELKSVPVLVVPTRLALSTNGKRGPP